MKKFAVVFVSLACAAGADAAKTSIPGWFLAGAAPGNFNVGLDKNNAHSGHASAFLCDQIANRFRHADAKHVAQ